MKKLLDSILNLCVGWIIVICSLLSSCKEVTPPVIHGEFPLIPQWQFRSREKITGIAFSNDTLLLGTNNNIFALNPNDGELLWEKEFGISPDKRKYAVNDNIIISVDSRSILSLNTQSKQVVPITTLDADNGGAEVIGLTENYIFVTRLLSWKVEVYNLLSGNLLWDVTVQRGGANIFPDINIGIVYIVTGRYIRAYDLDVGALLWEIERPEIINASFYQDGWILYVINHSDSSSIFALETNSMTDLWEVELEDQVNQIKFENNLIFASTGSGIVKLETSSGNIIWVSDINEEIFSSPILIDNAIYVNNNTSNRIYALSLETGKVIAYLELDGTAEFIHESSYPTELADEVLFFYIGNILFAYQ